MFDPVLTVIRFIFEAFLHIWPYLLVTIPLAVAVQMSGVSRYINRAFQTRPILAVFLATAVGAFSPLCSCSVVPMVAALLIGGVPLAPVMSFWIASPSMDPEIFFLSVATIGWELAVWRLAATLVLSLGAGLTTHFITQRSWLGRQVLRTRQVASPRNASALLGDSWRRFRRSLTVSPLLRFAPAGATSSSEAICCVTAKTDLTGDRSTSIISTSVPASSCGSGCSVGANSGCDIESVPFWRRLLKETRGATLMVVRFMALAYLLNALITLYVPGEWIIELLGRQNPWGIVTAAFLGVPAYASNLTALPMVGGLLAQGMNPAAALAFLIAGPTTTLPAMAAVWGIASRRVFALYISFAFVGAVVLGYSYSLVTSMF